VPVTRSDKCFACGKANPIGLKLEFKKESNKVVSDFVPNENLSGYENIVHGGIVSTLLDEAIAWACAMAGFDAFTAELTVRFKFPMRVGEKVRIEGWLTQTYKKLVFGEARILKDDTIIAYAKAKFMKRE